MAMACNPCRAPQLLSSLHESLQLAPNIRTPFSAIARLAAYTLVGPAYFLVVHLRHHVAPCIATAWLRFPLPHMAWRLERWTLGALCCGGSGIRKRCAPQARGSLAAEALERLVAAQRPATREEPGTPPAYAARGRTAGGGAPPEPQRVSPPRGRAGLSAVCASARARECVAHQHPKLRRRRLPPPADETPAHRSQAVALACGNPSEPALSPRRPCSSSPVGERTCAAPRVPLCPGSVAPPT